MALEMRKKTRRRGHEAGQTPVLTTALTIWTNHTIWEGRQSSRWVCVLVGVCIGGRWGDLVLVKMW